MKGGPSDEDSDHGHGGGDVGLEFGYQLCQCKDLCCQVGDSGGSGDTGFSEAHFVRVGWLSTDVGS